MRYFVIEEFGKTSSIYWDIKEKYPQASVYVIGGHDRHQKKKLLWESDQYITILNNYYNNYIDKGDIIVSMDSNSTVPDLIKTGLGDMVLVLSYKDILGK